MMKRKANVSVKQMARGYQEMGELNLQISNEYFLLEEEGEKLSGMGTKESQSKAE